VATLRFGLYIENMLARKHRLSALLGEEGAGGFADPRGLFGFRARKVAVPESGIW